MPSLEEAIDHKYGGDSFDCKLSSITIYVPKKNPRNVIPFILVLNDCDISSSGSENLASKCEGVKELDLAKNNLKEWKHVMDIFNCMPQLCFVNLSFNNLSEKLQVDCNEYLQMKNLVLNSTHVTWYTVRKLLKSMPNLEELHLSFNDFHTVELANNGDDEEENKMDDCECVLHECLKILHFTGNQVSTWYEVTKLGESFPQLESLVLAECPIKNLDPAFRDRQEQQQPQQQQHSTETNGNSVAEASKPDVNYVRSESESESAQCKTSSHHCFRHLKVLNLNYTAINSWEDIDRLGKFPALVCLRLQGCPLFENSQYTQHERRQLLIARLGNVQTLNGGGVITSEEREDAERAFIRHYMEKPESDRPDRYSDLSSIHGKLDPLVNIDLSPEKKVKVTFTHDSVSEVRLIDVYLTVSELKHKLDGFAGVPSRKMKLFYVDQDWKDVAGPEEMRYPNKQLYSYNISNGDEIIIDTKLS